jgi:hypothetical protein
MKRNLKLKPIGIAIMILTFSSVEVFLWHNKFSIKTIFSALFCILPFVLIVKFNNGKSSKD